MYESGFKLHRTVPHLLCMKEMLGGKEAGERMGVGCVRTEGAEKVKGSLEVHPFFPLSHGEIFRNKMTQPVFLD